MPSGLLKSHRVSESMERHVICKFIALFLLSLKPHFHIDLAVGHRIIVSQNCLGWERSLRSASPIVNLTLQSSTKSCP